MQEDYSKEWWRAGESDEFNLKRKLLRVGCRPLKRRLLACQKNVEDDGVENFHMCKKIRAELDDCYKALTYM
jgi:hypothetical protein